MGWLQASLEQLPGEHQPPQLQLFQRHFLLMNALYQLQQSLHDDGYYLQISPLAIHLQSHRQAATSALAESAGADALRDYYLDWSHFEQTGADQVDALLNRFWQQQLAGDKQLEAYQRLALQPGASWRTVQQRYRRLVAAHHPDRGGSSEEFVSIRKAYELLASVHGR